MVRKPDPEKIEKIRKLLKENPEGLWIREIARRSNLTKSTVSKYVNEYMKDEIEDVWKRGFIRIVRLKE
ncbi:MAG: winged helix-turn-helix transcriptional regulator [Candidatus Aenigmarchaeota archaeon]|nr:winged helix-turn-helix transcriptional regulator [Candidatus Aenigmarchaeota archaeon]